MSKLNQKQARSAASDMVASRQWPKVLYLYEVCMVLVRLIHGNVNRLILVRN